MFRRYGNQWAFEYSEEQIKEQLKRFPTMHEVPLRELQIDDRYFLIVVKVPHAIAATELGGVLDASTVLGNLFRENSTFLPEGTKITRSIEVTKVTANKQF